MKGIGKNRRRRGGGGAGGGDSYRENSIGKVARKRGASARASGGSGTLPGSLTRRNLCHSSVSIIRPAVALAHEKCSPFITDDDAAFYLSSHSRL